MFQFFKACFPGYKKAGTRSADPFDVLPNELKLHIFSMLNTPKELATAAQICKSWHDFIQAKDANNHDLLWKKFLGHLSRKEIQSIIKKNFIAAQKFFNILYAPIATFHDERFLVPAHVGVFSLDKSIENQILTLEKKDPSDDSHTRITQLDCVNLSIKSLKGADALKQIRVADNLKVILVYVTKPQDVSEAHKLVSRIKGTSESLLLFVAPEELESTLTIPAIVGLTLKKTDSETSFFARFLQKVRAIASLNILKVEDNEEDWSEVKTQLRQLQKVLVIGSVLPELKPIVSTVEALLPSRGYAAYRRPS